MKFIPNQNFKPPVNLPLVHQNDIPQFTFGELLEVSKFNDFDKLDIEMGECEGTKFLYIHNLLRNPLDLRKLMMNFPAENRLQSRKDAKRQNKGVGFSQSKAPGLQQPIERQLLPALGNELFFLIGDRLRFIKYRRESVNWKYFSNCFFPGMKAWDRNYLPHMDPFTYAANIFLTDHPKAATSFFKYVDPVTGKSHYNLPDVCSMKSHKDGTKDRYVEGIIERYGYRPKDGVEAAKQTLNKMGAPTKEVLKKFEKNIYNFSDQKYFKSPDVGEEKWEFWSGDEFYQEYLELPSLFNTLSFYRGNRWHSAKFDAENEKSARYSLVGVIE